MNTEGHLNRGDARLLQRAKEEAIIDAQEFLVSTAPPLASSVMDVHLLRARRIIATLLALVAEKPHA